MVTDQSSFSPFHFYYKYVNKTDIDLQQHGGSSTLSSILLSRPPSGLGNQSQSVLERLLHQKHLSEERHVVVLQHVAKYRSWEAGRQRYDERLTNLIERLEQCSAQVNDIQLRDLEQELMSNLNHNAN